MLWNRFAQLLTEGLDRDVPQARDAILSSFLENLSRSPTDAEAARVSQNLQRELARRVGEQAAHELYEKTILAVEAEEERSLQDEIGKRVSLGVPGFERIVDGLPACASVLLLGPPGSGKSTMAKQYIAQGLREGQSCMVVSMGEDRGLYAREMQRVCGMEMQQAIASGHLTFVDCYSWTYGKLAGRHDGVYTCASPTLDDVSLAIHYAMEGMPHKRVKRMAFDSLSSLFLYNNMEQVLRFTELLRGRMGNECFTSLFTVEEGMHPPEVLRALNAITDGVIQVGVNGGSFNVSVPRMRGSPASTHGLRLELSPRGLVVQDVWDALGRVEKKH